MGNPDKTIGILAAAGQMPLILTEHLKLAGYSPHIVAIKNVADAVLPIAHSIIRLGAANKIISSFKEAGCHQIIMTGKFFRPPLIQIRPDMTMSKIIFKALSSSDNDALELVADIFARHDLHMADLKSILPDIFAPLGVMAGKAPTDKQQASIDTGLSVLDALGNSDVGQAIVVQHQRVLAIEAAEGTNEMIRRAGIYKSSDLLPPILVKMTKRGQNKKLDPPVIGEETITIAAETGITIIVVEAGGVILADRNHCLSLAEELGITLIGVNG